MKHSDLGNSASDFTIWKVSVNQHAFMPRALCRMITMLCGRSFLNTFVPL